MQRKIHPGIKKIGGSIIKSVNEKKNPSHHHVHVG